MKRGINDGLSRSERNIGRLITFGVVALVVAIVALVPFGVYLAYKDSQRWAEFSLAHHCVAVDKEPDQMVLTPITTVGPNGTVSITYMPTMTPGRTGYACDDHRTYWR
ncbi:hypothetical protein CNR33_00006 [Pseudomonas phage tabernarius]|uniref:Uncharacterized protein n=1 Tax=Pseudomonas phage tabernarius TaxID=2048978 RepID=A0A2H4P6M6_9CAUD|nr:hypothetical protein FDJ17_gp06 [Pseudomonas phage tabernarius]ATW57852.1 hypothetical protein CNR33_00006 [Pseudomonas phage tabernarius]